jgi:hypothetical protein
MATRAHNFSRARGAKQTTHHGPLQRLLEGLVRVSIEAN